MNDCSIQFVRQCYYLMNSGFSIQESIESIMSFGTSKKEKALAQRVYKKMEEGYTIHEACLNQKEFYGSFWKKIFQNIEKTGNITHLFSLAIKKAESQKNNSNVLCSALVYPLSVLSILYVTIIFLYFKGIPLLENIGMISKTNAEHQILEGLKYASIFLICSSSTFIFSIFYYVQKLHIKENFWNIAHELAASNYTYFDCMDIASKSCYIKLPSPLLEKNYIQDSFFNAYEKSLLHTAYSTGEYCQILKAIDQNFSAHKDHIYSIIQKLIEPIITVITGITILIISIEVFIPLLIQGVDFL